MTLDKAALIIPPVQDFYTTPHRISSLGVETVRRILIGNGLDVRIIDGLQRGRRSVVLPLPEQLSYLHEHLLENETGRCSFFTKYRHFGLSCSEIVQMIQKYDPDICLISCFAFCYSKPVIELSGIIRTVLPEVPVAVGGAGVSVYPDYFLRCSSIDYTLSGEAEICLPLFLDYLRAPTERSVNTVYGLGAKTEGVHTIVPPEKYAAAEEIRPVIAETLPNDRRTVFATSLSRGCPAGCRFCSNSLVHGTCFRHVSIQQFEPALSELPDFPAGHEVAFDFEDDNLLFDFDFLMSILERCRSRFSRFGFTFENGIDYRLLSPEQCETLIKAGCGQFNFSLGSLRPEILERERRVLDLDRYEHLLSIVEQQGIPVVTYVICGFAEDTKESVAENLRYLSDKKTAIGLSLYYPVPGISGFEDRSIFDSIDPQCCTGAAAYPWGGNLDTCTLITAFRLARFINLLKSPVKNSEESEIIRLTTGRGLLHTVVKGRIRRIISVPKQDEELAGMVLSKL